MRRLDNDKKYSYTLIDSHFKADNFTKGRALKSFFDKFYQNIFEANLIMLEDIDYFPIAYNENNAYASIAHALHSLTPYVSSDGILVNKYSDKNARQIKDAVVQMCAIYDKVESAKAKGDKIRVVFFATPLPHTADKMSNHSAKTHKIMEDLLVDFLLNHFIVTIFYAVMDMQNDKHSNGESRAHFALGAIMLGLET